jgi:ArsR family transcriptional regulator
VKRREVSTEDVNRYAEMFSAIGTGPRLRIVRSLLSAHPGGMIVGDIQAETGVSGSTLSHHLDKLRHQGLIAVRREGTFLWYSVRIESLQELLGFLYAGCCTRNRVIEPQTLISIGR